MKKSRPMLINLLKGNSFVTKDADELKALGIAGHSNAEFVFGNETILEIYLDEDGPRTVETNYCMFSEDFLSMLWGMVKTPKKSIFDYVGPMPTFVDDGGDVQIRDAIEFVRRVKKFGGCFTVIEENEKICWLPFEGKYLGWSMTRLEAYNEEWSTEVPYGLCEIDVDSTQTLLFGGKPTHVSKDPAKYHLEALCWENISEGKYLSEVSKIFRIEPETNILRFCEKFMKKEVDNVYNGYAQFGISDSHTQYCYRTISGRSVTYDKAHKRVFADLGKSVCFKFYLTKIFGEPVIRIANYDHTAFLPRIICDLDEDADAIIESKLKEIETL